MGGSAAWRARRCASCAISRAWGLARGAAVLAAIEIGRRSVGERPARGRRIGSASELWVHLRARLSACTVEEFWALALDVRHRVLWEACLARGSLTGVEVHPRDVFRPLIRGGAAAVIFCHNHPSGDPAPSRQDLDLTMRLREVGELCGIAVLDHVVVGADGFTSLAQEYWTIGTASPYNRFDETADAGPQRWPWRCWSCSVPALRARAVSPISPVRGHWRWAGRGGLTRGAIRAPC